MDRFGRPEALAVGADDEDEFFGFGAPGEFDGAGLFGLGGARFELEMPVALAGAGGVGVFGEGEAESCGGSGDLFGGVWGVGKVGFGHGGFARQGRWRWRGFDRQLG